MDEDMKLLARADPAFQESLQSEVEPDPMEGEQTWPTDEELRQAEGVTPKYSITILGQTCFQSSVLKKGMKPWCPVQQRSLALHNRTPWKIYSEKN